MADPAPGMKPDVVCRAGIPFADGSFDVVACRTAAHHFSDVPAALAGMARVSRDRVLLVDTLNMGDDAEQAEALRDPSHVRNYTEAEWRAFAGGRRLPVLQVEQTANSRGLRGSARAHRLRGRGGRARARVSKRPRGGRPAHARQDRGQQVAG